jgi:hypothetical protein
MAMNIAANAVKRYFETCSKRTIVTPCPRQIVRRQWVVDAHRAGTLTLNGVGAHREEGENLRGEIKV